MHGISVLMSVYIKEKPEYLDKALESIFLQTRQADEIVLVEDGKLNKELYSVIQKYNNGSIKIKIVSLEQNMGLGKALNIGLLNCNYDLIARMDSDDIATLDRLYIQEKFMEENKDITVCGGNIAEFYEEGKVVRVKNMPLEYKALYKYAKYRNPLNHMTVMFRKQDILDVGNYMHLNGLEDYYLWSRVLSSGKKAGNIDKILVYARINRDFSGRRGGYNYFKQYSKLRRLQYELKLLNYKEYIYAWILSFGVTMQPKFIRKLIYKIFLRRDA